MELTKYGHSCVAFTAGDDRLVIDPGVFTDTAAALDGARAVLITHEHADHVDGDALAGALRVDPRLRVWAPSAVAESLSGAGEQVVSVEPGESFDAAGFAVQTFGGQHALIHISVPVVANVGYLVTRDGATVCHPGDSLEVPPVTPDVLLLPIIAPWSKVAEVIDFAVSTRPRRALPIHDAIVNDIYRGMAGGHVDRVGAPFGVQYEAFDAGQTVSV